MRPSQSRRPVLDTGQGFFSFFWCFSRVHLMEKGGWIYIMADRNRGGMYGMTGFRPMPPKSSGARVEHGATYTG
jgi:hypothetical protein